MTVRQSAARLLHHSPALQVMGLLALWLFGEGTVRLLSLPVPGGVMGLALLLVLLATRRLSAFSIRRGAQWFLADMLLFFVPAVLAVLDHHELLGLVGLKVLIVILASTGIVMVTTGFAVDRCYRWRARRAHSLDLR